MAEKDGAPVRRAAARARELDRKPAAVELLRRVRRLLPGDPAFGDPLSAAGQEGAAPIARLADRLFVDEPRATRELSLAALQVWQSMLEHVGRGRGDQEMTILFTDIVGFSDWALQVGDEDALKLLREVAAATEPAVTGHRGKVVKRLGDGLMAVFPSAPLAFDAAAAMQARVREVCVAGHRPRLRTALHCGRPRAIGGDYLGVDVNIAARLCERAGPGEILVSAPVVDKLDPDSVDVRRKRSFLLSRPKGVPADLEIFAAAPAAES